ncbi:MAG: type II toxin-antitoxin system PemK/MazF family toxin [Bacilli bacterium]|nr:type II toxin-antitoxin system PemK/MazF family toxin [Bacilli bacterium]
MNKNDDTGKEKQKPTKEKKELMMKKRRIPLAQPYFKGESAKHRNGLTNTHIFAYKYFEPAFTVKAGDVYLARFPIEYGSEIHGDHFVAVLLDSPIANPLVTVVPLKSEKAKEINPASDIRLGVIEGINNGRKTIAVINQTRPIDKRRLLSEEAISALHSLVKKNLLKDYEEVCAEVINCYRLTKEQYELLKKKAVGYIKNNYISHDDE